MVSHVCREREEKEKKKVTLYTYVGETAKRAHKRGGEHVYDMKNLLKHVVDRHEGEEIPAKEFRMKVFKFHRSSFERQINESEAIQFFRMGNYLLNSKSEFDWSAVPRLALKMGSRNVGADRLKEVEGEEQERTILDRIRNLWKLAGKRRNGGGGGEPNNNPAP